MKRTPLKIPQLKIPPRLLPDIVRAYGIYLLILIATTAGFCNTSESDAGGKEDDVPSKLSSSTLIRQKGKLGPRVFANFCGLDMPTKHMKYKVSLYKINYTTNYKGKDIIASGIVLVPDTDDSISILSFQHGTIASNAEAPSELQSSAQELKFYHAVAATGLMIVVPDFIGFGSSSDIMHPYFVEELTATTVIDNIYAAENLAEEVGAKLNGRLYLAGYSQGGYATMATHKYIEEHGIKGFNLKASFTSSGGYDVQGIQDYYFSQEIFDHPFYLAYVAHAYQATFDLQTDLSCYFNEPYASTIPDLFDGSLTGGEINNRLNDTLNVLLNKDYLAGYRRDQRFALMDNAFKENSLLDWAPKIRLYMYHGEQDTTVPFQNSLDTYNQLLANGSSESVISLTSLPGANHISGIFLYAELFINELTRLEGLSEREL